MIRAVIDIETTGLFHNVHEIIQLAVITFDEKFEPIHKFMSHSKPLRHHLVDPEALRVNGLSLESLLTQPLPSKVRKAFLEWKHDLYGEDKITPLGHNYAEFDSSFLKAFFSHDLYNKIFNYGVMDSKIFARGLIDSGKLPDISTSLDSLTKHFGIERRATHEAYEDAIATLKLYKKLISL